MGDGEEMSGPMVGGPWDGGEHTAGGACRRMLLYSAECTGGAVYEWDGREWRYAGVPAPNAFATLLETVARRRDP